MFCKNCGNEIDDDAIICWKCGTRVVNEEPVDKTQSYDEPNTPLKSLLKKHPFILWFIVAIVLAKLFCCVNWFTLANSITDFLGNSISNIHDSMHKLQPPEKLKCVKHKGLCIANRDVYYDYDAIKYYSSYYNDYKYDQWTSAQRACQAWGGRLPHIEEFDTILDANSKLKIRLKTQTKYFSDTLDDPTRDDIIMTYQHDIGLMKYLNKIIYDNEPIGWTYKISFMNETPYRARCVKD